MACSCDDVERACLLISYNFRSIRDPAKQSLGRYDLLRVYYYCILLLNLSNLFDIGYATGSKVPMAHQQSHWRLDVVSNYLAH